MIERIANDPAFHVEMDFQPGDVQLLNNAVILHAARRTTTTRSPNASATSCRLWLQRSRLLERRERPAGRHPEAGRMIDKDLARRASAEAVGTALLVAIVVGSGIAAQRLSPNDVGLQLLENSTATGAGLVALILALGAGVGRALQPGRDARRPPARRDLDLRRLRVRRRAGRGRRRRGDGGQPDVRAARGHAVDAHAFVGRAVARRARRGVRSAAGDPRRRPLRPRERCRVRGGRLHRGRVLVHVVDELREPGGDDRPLAHRHLRRDRAAQRADVRRDAGRRARSSPSSSRGSGTRRCTRPISSNRSRPTFRNRPRPA